MSKELEPIECLEKIVDKGRINAGSCCHWRECLSKNKCILHNNDLMCDDYKRANTIKQALLKSQENKNKALAFDYLVKHFNFECKAESIRNGEKWARFVTIQSKDDKGTWDTTAMANLVDYKEEYEFLEKMLKPKN